MKTTSTLMMLLLTTLCSTPFSNAEPSALKLAFAQGQRTEINVAAINILKEAYDKLGYQVIIVELPGQRALSNSNQGLLDGELHRVAGINKDYPNLIQIPIPIVVSHHVAFSNRAIEITGWESLRSLKVVITRGYRMGEKNTLAMNPMLVNHWKQAFEMLKWKRADVTVANKYRGRHLLKQIKKHNIKELTPPLAETPLFHYLHIKHRALIPKISKALKQMKNSGRMHSILAEVESNFKE